MTSDATTATANVLHHHLTAVLEADIAAILSDYSEQSVLYLPEGPLRGIVELRNFYTGFLENKPEGTFEILRRDVEGEIAYLVWKLGSAIPLGTDTFIIKWEDSGADVCGLSAVLSREPDPLETGPSRLQLCLPEQGGPARSLLILLPSICKTKILPKEVVR